MMKISFTKMLVSANLVSTNGDLERYVASDSGNPKLSILLICFLDLEVILKKSSYSLSQVKYSPWIDSSFI